MVDYFYNALRGGLYLEALLNANDYERENGHVIDCRHKAGVPHLFLWAQGMRSDEPVSAVFDVIERGGGVTLDIATIPFPIGPDRYANAMSLAARSAGRVQWIDSLLKTPPLRAAWGVRDHSGLVPLHEFLKSMPEPFMRLGGDETAESAALQMLDQTPIESLVAQKAALGCLQLAVRLRLVHLVVELLRRNVPDLASFPTYLGWMTQQDRAKWEHLYAENRFYHADILPILQSALDNSVSAPDGVPKPLVALIAQFVRGPFQL
jgi:hypothetical protein